MTTAEFNNLVRTLKGAFPYKDFINDDAISTWFNFLNQFQYEDARRGVLDYIELNNRTPTINDIVSSIRNAQKYSKRLNNPYKTYVKCPKCNDLGYTLRSYPNGSEYLHVCDCERAREKYPWDFMSKAEQDEWYENEQRIGRSVSRPFRAEKEYVRDYLYPKTEQKKTVDVMSKMRALKQFEEKQSDAFHELLEN